MVNRYPPRSDRLDATFAALSDPVRRGMIERLAEGNTSVSVLAQPFDISLPAVSRHVRVLERAGLLRQERDGRVRRCHLVSEPLREAHQWVERYRAFWTHQLDALADFLEDLPGKPSNIRKARR